MTGLISAEELRGVIDDADVRIVDCRFDFFAAGKGHADYLARHIPGAVYADLDTDLAGPITESSGRHPLPDPDTFVATLQKWGIGDDSRVIVYDAASGALASRLWWMLNIWFGLKRVELLDGGLAHWIATGGSLEAGEVTPRAATFTHQADFSTVVSTGDIVASIKGEQDLELIDARDAVRYRGESEPIDPKAGHVPGARNLPLTVSVEQDGRWKARETLSDIWQAFSEESAQKSAVTMCGSGITACHLIFSAVIAGRPPPKLYVGSWSEWIRDDSRPVARGEAL